MCLINDVLHADLPDEPPWRSDHVREYLAVNMPEERRLMWFAEDDAGTAADGGKVLGSASLLLVGGQTGVLDLFVRADARRQGIARELLNAVAWRANAERRRTLTVEVIGGTPGVRFYEACGFHRTLVEVRHVLTLEHVHWPRTEQIAGQLANGYRVEYLPGGPPEEMLEPYARAKLMLRHLPGDDFDIDRMVSIEANRLRASLSTLRRRGMRSYVVVVTHDATRQVAGLTELVVPAHRPERADQYDTLVVQAHRGYGLGLAMKARMLMAMRDDEPQIRDVVTWQTLEMEQMARVNSVLGFVPDREWYEYEADVPELLAHLSS
ncbi:MAG: GNAT family N-acetyltransferase [Micromonosporaceae bacterium]|nr:GNAT family N-acetyltransferase [Micromonosporaceae bacterium]